MTSTVSGRATNYRLLVPAGWFRIPLAPERAEASVRAFVDRQFKGIDSLPALRRDLVAQLLRQTDKARDAGGIELHVATDVAGPLPLAASLVVSVLRDFPSSFGPLAPADWCDYLRSRGQDAELAELPAGTAVRTRRRAEPKPDDPLGNTLPTTNLDLRIPIPHTANYLQLAFSTPLDPLADAFVELFDAISLSLRWVE